MIPQPSQNTKTFCIILLNAEKLVIVTHLHVYKSLGVGDNIVCEDCVKLSSNGNINLDFCAETSLYTVFIDIFFWSLYSCLYLITISRSKEK